MKIIASLLAFPLLVLAIVMLCAAGLVLAPFALIGAQLRGLDLSP